MLIGSVNLSKSLDPSSRFGLSRTGTKTIRTLTGQSISYDGGSTIIQGELVFKFLSNSQKIQLEQFFAYTIRFGLFTFNITPDAWDDLGLGVGVTIPNASYAGEPNTNSIFTPTGRLNKWDAVIPYWYAIPASAGVMDSEGVYA